MSYADINNVPSLEEIKKMDKETAKNVILRVRSYHSIKNLAKHWNVHDHTLYQKIFPAYDIKPSGKRGGNWRKNRKQAQLMEENNSQDVTSEYKQGSTEDVLISAANDEDKTVEVEKVYVQNSNHSISGFKIALAGCFDTSVVKSRVNGLMGTLMEGKKYIINITLEEVE